MQHSVIKTQHVFSNKDQVFLKSIDKTNKIEKWCSINFKWIPIVKL